MTFVCLLVFLLVVWVGDAWRSLRPTSFRRISCFASKEIDLTREALEALTRAELQSIAKARGIKANGKSVDIISTILSDSTVQAPVAVPAAETITRDVVVVPSEKKISGKVLSRLSADALQVLEDQGIDLSDLLTLQMRSVQQSGSFVRSYPSGTQKRGKSVKYSPEDSSISSSSSDSSPGGIQKISSATQTTSTSVISIDDLLDGNDGEEEDSPAADLKSIAHLIEEDPAEEEVKEDRSQVVVKARLPPRSQRMELIDLDGKEKERQRLVALEGVTLKQMLQQLSQQKGYDFLYRETHLRCFSSSPSLNSASKLLREPSMSWARRKIEDLYLKHIVSGRSKLPQQLQ